MEFTYQSNGRYVSANGGIIGSVSHSRDQEDIFQVRIGERVFFLAEGQWREDSERESTSSFDKDSYTFKHQYVLKVFRMRETPLSNVSDLSFSSFQEQENVISTIRDFLRAEFVQARIRGGADPDKAKFDISVKFSEEIQRDIEAGSYITS